MFTTIVNVASHTGAVVSVSGNVTGGNVLTGGLVSATANVTGGNILTGGIVSSTGNITAAFFTGNGAGLTGVIASGNVGAATKLENGTSEMNIPASGGNIIGNVAGTTNIFTLYTGGLTIAGVVSASGNVTAGNILTGGLLSATSTITSAANITGGNLLTGGLVSATANITANNGMFTNIVNVASHTGAVVSVSGNVTGGNLLTAGLISATSTITSAANITGGNILTGGLVSATANITGGNLLTGGLISATSTITSAANITGGNILTGGLISATGTITTAGNLSLTGNIVDAGTLWINTAANGNINLNVNGTGQTNIPTGILSVTGNIQGGNLRTAGLISATANVTSGNVTTGGVVSATSNIIGGNVLTGGIVSATGNVLGNVFTVNLGNTTTAIDNGGGNAVGNIGSSSKYFNQVFAQATTALYADLAEIYSADAEYAPGTVVSFGGSQEVTRSVVEGDNRVAGVISENPSYLMNSGLQAEHRAAVALTGRVPTLVIGPVAKGDMMISAGNGWARASATPAMGTVIGKALKNFDGDSGIIEIVIGRL